MTSTINASTTAGLVQTADTSGVLALQTAGTTAVSISASQVVTFTNPPTGVFPSGTAMLFVQTAAPTGWTKSTANNDKALRVVSGSASTGGSVAFTTAFASQAVSGTVGTSGATTLSTAQIPSHNHTAPGVTIWSTYNGGNPPTLFSGTTAAANSGTPTSTYYGPNTGAEGGGGSHTHTGGTFTGTAINLAVQYVDVIIATKD